MIRLALWILFLGVAALFLVLAALIVLLFGPGGLVVSAVAALFATLETLP